jgi:hypothetical protein
MEAITRSGEIRPFAQLPRGPDERIDTTNIVGIRHWWLPVAGYLDVSPGLTPNAIPTEIVTWDVNRTPLRTVGYASILKADYWGEVRERDESNNWNVECNAAFATIPFF